MPVKRLVLLLLLLACPGWCQFAWKAQMTYDHTKTGTADSPSFPAVVYGSDTSLKDTGHGGTVQSSSGADILFFTDSTLATQIASQIDYYDNVNGIFWGKVLISTLSHSSNGSVYIAVGNASPPARTSGVWDANYHAVWPFKNGTTLDLTDATTNGNNGTASSPPPVAAIGQIDGAVTVSLVAGVVRIITLSPSSSLNITGKLLTVEFWVQRSDASAAGTILDSSSTGSPWAGYDLSFNASTSNSFTLLVRGECSINFGAMAQDTNWHHVVVVSDSAHVTAYVDGAASSGVGTSCAIDSASGGSVLIGPSGVSVAYTLDELRLSATNRSSSWVTASYNNQYAPGNIGSAGFWTWGSWVSNSDFSCSGPSSGYDLQASTAFTCSKNSGTWSTGNTVTISDGSQGGYIAPSVGSPGTAPVTVTPGNGASSFTYTYAPAVTGALTLAYTNNYSGTNSGGESYTSNPRPLTFSGCTSGSLRAASSTCTLTASGTSFDIPATVTLADHGQLGTFSTTMLTFTGGTVAPTFTYTPYLVGVKLITGTPSGPWSTGALSFSYTSSSADASTFTAKASGNWASSGTWNCTSGGCGHATPDTGDTVIIPGYHVTIPISTTAFMGTCPTNNTTYDLQISDNAGVASGWLEIAGKLWLCGNRILTAGTHSLGGNPTTWPILQLDTGGELDVDNNQNVSVAYRTVSANDYGWGKLYAGTAGDACTFSTGTCPTTIKGVNLGAANPDLFEATQADSLVYRIYGTLISDCGGASKGCLEYKTGNGSASNNYGDAGVIDLRGDIFNRTGTFQSPVNGVYGVIPSMSVLGNRFVNDLAGFESLDANGGTNYVKSCTFTGNYFSGLVGQPNVPMGGCTWTGNTFAGALIGGSGGFPYGSFTDNVIVEPPPETVMSSPVAARNVWMKQTAGLSGSTHTMAGPATNVWRATENICMGVGSGSEGHCINFNTMAPGGPWTMLNNISLPTTGNGANSGEFLTYAYGDTTAPLVYYDHNGHFGAATYSWGVSVGHDGPFFPSNTVVQSYRANVHWSASSGTSNFPIGNSELGYANGLGNSVNTANLGWNAMYHQTVSTGFAAGVNSNCNVGSAGSAYLGSAYDICIPTRPSPDNTTYDLVSTDPKVLDNTRNPFTWASRVHGGTASEAGMEAVLAACQDETWCIEEMRTWIARGFQPTNLALKGKAHDGRIVGFTGTYGNGYTGGCTVTFTPQDAADLGTGAAATCSFVSGVPVIQITNSGANYRIATPATVAIGGTCTGGCVAASLTPVISPHDIGPVQMALIPGAM